MIFRREEKQYVEGMEDEEISRRETPNLAYPPAFKLEVALYAQRFSQYAAAKIFSVARRRIFDWMRQISKLQDLIEKGHMKKMTGRGPKNRDIDQALYDWYCERRKSGERPRSCEVRHLKSPSSAFLFARYIFLIRATWALLFLCCLP